MLGRARSEVHGGAAGGEATTGAGSGSSIALVGSTVAGATAGGGCGLASPRSRACCKANGTTRTTSSSKSSQGDDGLRERRKRPSVVSDHRFASEATGRAARGNACRPYPTPQKQKRPV